MKKSFKQKFISDTLPALIVLVVLIIVLELVTDVFHLVSPRILPSPYSIYLALKEFLSLKTGDYTATLGCMLIGYCIAVPLGITLAGLIAQSKFVIRAFSPLVVVLATTPLMVLVPLLMIWLGWGDEIRVISVTIQATPIILLNTLVGFTDVPMAKEEMAKVYGANRARRFFKVVVPQSLPRVFTGLRLGVINATLGVIGAEFTMKQIGMGYRILISCSYLNIPLAYGCIVLTAVTSRCLMAVVTFVENKLTGKYRIA